MNFFHHNQTIEFTLRFSVSYMPSREALIYSMALKYRQQCGLLHRSHLLLVILASSQTQELKPIFYFPGIYIYIGWWGWESRVKGKRIAALYFLIGYCKYRWKYTFVFGKFHRKSAPQIIFIDSVSPENYLLIILFSQNNSCVFARDDPMFCWLTGNFWLYELKIPFTEFFVISIK